jgi:hypothetical protein
LTALANGQPLTGLRVTVPWRGAPIVEATAPEAVTPAGGVVSFLLGDLAVTATLVPGRSGEFSGSWSGLAVAGRGGWRKTIPAKGYRSPAGLLDVQIFADAARECGELPPVVSAPRNVGGFYVRREGRASDAFGLLAPGQDWWINSAGVTIVGQRLPTLTAAPFDLLEWDPARGRVTIATDSPAAFAPGVTFADPLAGSFTVNSVVWTATAAKLRGEVWTS